MKDVTAYTEQLHALLPPGRALPRTVGGTLDSLMAAIAEELVRIDGRGDDLLSEALADTTDELLPDWERVAGLPGGCITGTQTKQARRGALVAKLSDTGEVTPQAFIDAAARIGYTITVTEFVASDPAGGGGSPWPADPLDYVFVLRINAAETTVEEFRAGASGAGEQLRTWGNELLECTLTQMIQAHWVIVFAYG